MERYDTGSMFTFQPTVAQVPAYMHVLRRTLGPMAIVRIRSASIPSLVVDVRTSERKECEDFCRDIVKACGRPQEARVYISTVSEVASHAFTRALLPAYTPPPGALPSLSLAEGDVLARLLRTFYDIHSAHPRHAHLYADPESIDGDGGASPVSLNATVNPHAVIASLHACVPLASAYVDPTTGAFLVQSTRGACLAVVRGVDVYPHGPALDIETGVIEDPVWRDYFPQMNADVAAWNDAALASDGAPLHGVLRWHALCSGP